MTYAEAIQFLYGLQMVGTTFGLERTRRLAALSGNPETQLRFIHVAGTNGKGSTCAMLESIYRAAGLRVGLFTSPHLVSFRERIQINRQLISEAGVVQLVIELQKLLKEFPTEEHPTMFEVVTVMALKYFAEQKCDLVIWETGLGGRLDATNIITPLASVITNIAFDHQQWLGDTLEKIAAEKAGIIKPGIPIVSSAIQPEVLAVIKRTAEAFKAPLAYATQAHTLEFSASLPLLGEHQKQNAALAVTTVEVLQNEIPVTEKMIRSGISTVHWPGRLQLIERGSQRFLLDGAHNLAGVNALRASLESDLPFFTKQRVEHEKISLIVGLLNDKDWRQMCEVLAPLADRILTVPVASGRTADANALAKVFRATNPQATVVASKNFSEALAACKDEPLVVVTGSLYLIGEALELLGNAPTGAGERRLNEWSAKR